MFTLARISAVVLVPLFITLSAHADAVATLEGIVKDPNGHALKGAEIRIQGKDPNKIGTVHTDVTGHYVYPALETGTYSVTLVVSGAVMASITNVKTQLGETEKLNFELQKGATAKPFMKSKHYVWIPADATTGTHLGSWIEVDDDAPKMPIGMQERVRDQGNSWVRDFRNQHPSSGSTGP